MMLLPENYLHCPKLGRQSSLYAGLPNPGKWNQEKQELHVPPTSEIIKIGPLHSINTRHSGSHGGNDILPCLSDPCSKGTRTGHRAEDFEILSFVAVLANCIGLIHTRLSGGSTKFLHFPFWIVQKVIWELHCSTSWAALLVHCFSIIFSLTEKLR